MLAIIRLSLLVVVYLLCLTDGWGASPPTIDASLAEYLQSVSKYSTVKYSAKYFAEKDKFKDKIGRETLQGFYLLKKFDAKVHLTDRSFYISERFYPDNAKGSINRVTSWHRGFLREYVEDDSPGLSKGVLAADGVIKERELETGDLPAGPRMALGFGITECVGKSCNLADLILHTSVETLATNHYMVKNIFGWNESFGSAYDLEFTLDPDHGYLPKKFTFWDRSFGERVSRDKLTECTVNRFSKANDLWCPIDISCCSYSGNQKAGMYRIVVDERSLELNFVPTDTEFMLTFPDTKAYIDVPKKLLHRPNQVPLNIADRFGSASALTQNSSVVSAPYLRHILFDFPVTVSVFSGLALLAFKLRNWRIRLST